MAGADGERGRRVREGREMESMGRRDERWSKGEWEMERERVKIKREGKMEGKRKQGYILHSCLY